MNIILRSTSDSIKLRQPSVVAIIETLIAIVLFFVLVSTFGWAFPTLIISFAAPALLLRSGSSTRLGASLLQSAVDNRSPGNTFALCFSFVATGIVGSVFLFWIRYISNYPIWSIFAASIWAGLFLVAFGASAAGKFQGLTKIVEVGYAIAGITLAVSVIFATAIVTSRIELVTNRIPPVVLTVAQVCIAVVTTYVFDGSIRKAEVTSESSTSRVDTKFEKTTDIEVKSVLQKGLDLLTRLVMRLFNIYGEQAPYVRHFIRTIFLFALSYVFVSAFLVLVFSTFTAIILLVVVCVGSSLAVISGATFGTICLGVVIRTASTLRFLLSGIRALPANWIQCTMCIDFFHAPELLPRATKVSAEYGTGGLLKASGKLPHGFQKVAAYVMISCLYLSAVFYRFSIKATAWIWWPLVIAARRPFHPKATNTGHIRQKIAVAIQGPIGILVRGTLVFFIFAVAYQILSMSDYLLTVLPKESTDVIASLIRIQIIPTSGIRLAFFALTVVLATVFWWQSASIVGAYEETLKSPKELQEMQDSDKGDFLRRSRIAEKTRLCLIASLIFFIELQLISSAAKAYPDVLAMLIWPWILVNI